MSLEGFVEYKRRAFCNDVKCPVQMKLNQQKAKSEAYEQIRLRLHHMAVSPLAHGKRLFDS
jgi:hypothetical protein